MKSTSLLRASVLSGLMLAGGAYAAEMTLYTGPNLRGSDITLNGPTSNLDRSGFNDRAESVIVRSGRWEVCTDKDFSGYCTVLGPGQYRQLDGPLLRSISSAREIAPIAYDDRQYYRYGAVEAYPRYGAVAVEPVPRYVETAPPVYVETVPPRYVETVPPRYVETVPPRYVENRGRYSALEVYSLPAFKGSTMKFDAAATTLDTATTNEGVSSLIVREGVWELCTGAKHDGSCRVYEPGRYPRLGAFEGSPVGSLRRIG